MSSVFARPPRNPLHEQPYSYDRVKVEPYKPRDLESAHSSPSMTSERRFDANAPFEMAHPDEQRRRGLYEVPQARVEDGFVRPDLNQRTSREQLPPLSSLFSGPAPTPPPQPPYSERSPAFPSASPQVHRPAPPLSMHEQKTWDAGYPQHSVSQSPAAPYPYLPRTQQSSSDLPPPPRPRQEAPRPNSPRFYEPRYGQETPRAGGGSAISRWSPHGEPTFREYHPSTSRDTSSSFRSHIDHHPPINPALRTDAQARPPYRDPGVASAPQYPPTPASTVASDALTGKDGLGPKIWTGTQFLPRFVRQAEVPGEGLCYFYDDGTHCKAHIDGEAVNAHWGVTKAGKPRKRLAIACITCREKKIKCDPDYPRCIQCEKFGRVCKFKNAPRGGQGSPDSPPQMQDSDQTMNRTVSEMSDSDSHRSERREAARSASPMAGVQTSPGSEAHGIKRRRNDYSKFTALNYERPRDTPIENPKSFDGSDGRDIGTRCELISKLRSENPYDVNQDLVDELMALYFTHITSTSYSMIPEKVFVGWLRDRSITKSEDDLILIYGMLALATVFSMRADLKRQGKDYADVVRFSCDRRQFSLQMAQARVLLAMYYYATNQMNDCLDISSAAVRAATAAKLNVEIDKAPESQATSFPFNFSRDGYAECRRRTFWSCFIMERFITGITGNISSIHTEDIFLRFPSDDLAFEEQSAIANPLFHYAATPIHDAEGTIGPMGYLVNISTLWSEVMTKIYRTSNAPVVTMTGNPTPSCNTFYATNTARLEGWRATLPSHLVYSPENLEKAAANGMLGYFITMHLIYHTAQMKLNRVVPVSALPPAQLPGNIRVACKHASAVLDMIDILRARRGFGHREYISPMLGYATLGAVDILSCQGTMADAHDLARRTTPTVSIMADQAALYSGAREQYQLIVDRVEELKAMPKPGEGSSSWNAANGRDVTETDRLVVNRESGTFEFKKPLDVAANDCLYGAPVDIWVKALAEK